MTSNRQSAIGNRLFYTPFALIADCWLLIALSGCAHVPFRAARPAQPLSAEIAAYYDYPARPQEVTRQLTKDTPRVTEWLMQFPLSASGFEPTEPVVEFEWFESKQPGQRPAILFNPILRRSEEHTSELQSQFHLVCRLLLLKN